LRQDCGKGDTERGEGEERKVALLELCQSLRVDNASNKYAAAGKKQKDRYGKDAKRYNR
jgi:hypothetical protein